MCRLWWNHIKCFLYMFSFISVYNISMCMAIWRLAFPGKTHEIIYFSVILDQCGRCLPQAYVNTLRKHWLLIIHVHQFNPFLLRPLLSPWDARWLLVALHNDYGSQVLYLLSDNKQGIKTRVGTFGEYAFFPFIATVLDLKDAKKTQTRRVGSGGW